MMDPTSMRYNCHFVFVTVHFRSTGIEISGRNNRTLASRFYHLATGWNHLPSSSEYTTIGLYRDVWIAANASSTTSLATRTAAICVRFQGRRVRTMQITFLTRKSALIYRRGLRQSRQPHSQLQWRFRDKSLLALV